MSDVGDLLREQFVSMNNLLELHVGYAREDFAGKQMNYVARLREILICDLAEGRDLDVGRARTNLRHLLGEIEVEARPIYEAMKQRYRDEKAAIERQNSWGVAGDDEDED